MLTQREFDVLLLVALGHKQEAICRKLDISMYAVKGRLSSICRKLDAVNSANAVHIAWQKGILP